MASDALGAIQDVEMLRALYDTQIPSELKDIKWDVILVDGPEESTHPNYPCRCQSIYAAHLLANENTTVFVDDCQRVVDDHYTMTWLVHNGTRLQRFDNGHGGSTCRVSPA
eukprot:gnl/MRDRNA2_/MRDRNA2_56641_c0_seq3.p1 gnl/MRDRNA2_/MRDRNA2_56641_c0~~gnl/MRDRNA2_/MRDRNA2_56641_c0_seq3.p1  ORF type:complete len:111 (-),score=12.33 gnl/MRDRNA2_/MRDRNA2_56641_c0_seq3:276-608(-)